MYALLCSLEYFNESGTVSRGRSMFKKALRRNFADITNRLSIKNYKGIFLYRLGRL